MYEPLLWEMQQCCSDRDGSSEVGLTWLQVGLAAAPTVAVWRCDLFVPTLSRPLRVSLCFGKPKYAGVQMAISKVHKAQTFLGIVSRSATPVIQIVLIDDRAGGQVGTAAEQLAADIMESIAQHGNTPVLLSSSPAPRHTAGQSFVFPASSPHV